MEVLLTRLIFVLQQWNEFRTDTTEKLLEKCTAVTLNVTTANSKQINKRRNTRTHTSARHLSFAVYRSLVFDVKCTEAHVLDWALRPSMRWVYASVALTHCGCVCASIVRCQTYLPVCVCVCAWRQWLSRYLFVSIGVCLLLCYCFSV